jgi:hypothetical protein
MVSSFYFTRLPGSFVLIVLVHLTRLLGTLTLLYVPYATYPSTFLIMSRHLHLHLPFDNSGDCQCQRVDVFALRRSIGRRSVTHRDIMDVILQHMINLRYHMHFRVDRYLNSTSYCPNVLSSSPLTACHGFITNRLWALPSVAIHNRSFFFSSQSFKHPTT